MTSAPQAHGIFSSSFVEMKVLWVHSMWIGLFIFGSLTPGMAQKTEEKGVVILQPAEGEKAAKTLVDKMLAQKPAENSVRMGQLKIYEGKGKWREVPLKIEVRSTPTNILTIYETTKQGGEPDTRLLIGHAGTNPNTYKIQSSDAKGNMTEQSLSGSATLAPFVGSDFWIADLGLEFLHWPTQRVLRKEMRRSQFCEALESTNPDPKIGYKRVLCWIDTDPPYGIVHAEAYDSKNDLLKNFDPTEFKKVEGQYELEEMEIRNRQTGSRTKIQFNVE
jgi:hypothetical protein